MTYISQYDPLLNICRGLVPGHGFVNKFGRNSDVDTTTDPEDVWMNGGLWVPPTTARIHDIVSTDAADANPSGNGARSVRIIGLDASWDPQEESVSLNGVTPVPTLNSYTRIFRMYIESVGNNGQNDGSITATAQTDSTITCGIAPNNNQSLVAFYTVPRAKTAYITQFYGTINTASGATAAADISMRVKEAVDVATSPARIRHWLGVSFGSPTFFNPKPYIEIPEKSDIVLRCESVTDNNTDVSAGFDLILVDD